MTIVPQKPLTFLLIGLAIGLALTGCTAQPASPTASPTRVPQPAPAPTRAPLPTVLSPLSPLPTPVKALALPTSLPGSRTVQAGTDPIALQETNAAIDDLSKRTGIAKSDIKVVSIEAVQWPDTSVGCPQPGRMYAQVIVPGYRIILEAGGKTYEYHSAGSGATLCQPKPQS